MASAARSPPAALYSGPPVTRSGDRLSLAALKHPNICVTEAVAQEGETTFLVTEYLEGETLAKRLRAHDMALPPRRGVIESREAMLELPYALRQ